MLTALVLYPVFIAVAVPAESGVCALLLYVFTSAVQGILTDLLRNEVEYNARCRFTLWVSLLDLRGGEKLTINTWLTQLSPRLFFPRRKDAYLVYKK